MACWFYVGRGMRSIGAYGAGFGSFSGSQNGSTINQVPTVSNLEIPGGEKSSVLFISIKGLNDSGDFSSFSTFMGGQVTNTRYNLSLNNSMLVFHGITTQTPASTITQNFSATWTSNTLPVALACAIVVY
jgi:hypothetical protein